MTPEQRDRRIRVVRRARQADGLPTRVLTVRAHRHELRLWDHTGRIAGHWRHGKVYEGPLLEHLYRRRLRGLALDVGANLGNHSIWLAQVCGLQVVAFEPVAVRELRDNIVLNGLSRRVRIEPVALGAVTGTAEHVGAGRLAAGGDISVRTLDSYRLANVTLIKIDVEGMEPHVLRGGEQTIRHDRPVIWAEEHNQAEHDAIAEVLQPWRYRMVDRLHRRGQATPMGRWEHR